MLRRVEDGLQTAVDAALMAGLGREDLIEILDGLIQAEHEYASAQEGKSQ